MMLGIDRNVSGWFLPIMRKEIRTLIIIVYIKFMDLWIRNENDFKRRATFFPFLKASIFSKS